MYKVKLENDDFHRLYFEFEDYEQMMIFAEYALRKGTGDVKVTLSITDDNEGVNE